MVHLLIRWSIAHRIPVLFMAGVLVVGVFVTSRMPIDVFPDLTAPTVTVIVEGHGISAKEMETQVTFPIEAAVNGAPDVRRVRSGTAVGIAVVWIEFEWGTDIYRARQTVAERLATVSGSLPPQVEPPKLAPASSIMGEILFISLTSPSHSLFELRTVATTQIRQRLLSIAGVSQVTPIGGDTKQYQVVLSPKCLRAFGLSPTEVARALEETNENVAAGVLASGPQETIVEPGVIVAIQKQPGANTLEPTGRPSEALAGIQASLPSGMHIDKDLFRQANFIDNSVRNTTTALLKGAVVATLIVVAFLASGRASVITLLALPLFLLTSVLVLRALGSTINTMTLGGMAIAIWALVDDAIIYVENVVRRLRENRRLSEQRRKPVLDVVYAASSEVQTSVVLATFIIVLGFTPIFVLSGVEERLLPPLGLAFTVALGASLLTAITVRWLSTVSPLQARTLMDSTFTPSSQSRSSVLTASTLALFTLSACQAATPDPATEVAISKAIGLTDPIAFRLDGAPIDEPTAGDTLTFADATRRAVSSSPRLQAALARVRIALADADQARLLPNPVLIFAMRWGPGNPQIEVSLVEDIIGALQVPKRSRAADNRLRQAAAEAVTVALDVMADLQGRYAEAQVAGRRVANFRSRLELLGRLTQVARSRLEAGEGVLSDVTTLESQRIELDVRLDEAGHVERAERLKLARLIGEPSGQATWNLDEWTLPQPVMVAEEQWIRTGLQNRPEVQAVAWELAALGDDYAIARLFQWEGFRAGADVFKDADWVVGPSIATPVPVFDTGQARRKRVTAEQIEARHELTSAQRQVVEDVRLAHLDLEEGIHHLERVRDELMPLLERRSEQAERSYQCGQTDVTALYLAQQDLRAAESLEIEFEREATGAFIRLWRAAGGPGVAAEVMPPTPFPEQSGSSVHLSSSTTAAARR